MDGQGTYHYSSGDIYTGGFRQGRKHGSGMYNFKAHACQFLGIWSDGEFVEGKWVSRVDVCMLRWRPLASEACAVVAVQALQCDRVLREAPGWGMDKTQLAYHHAAERISSQALKHD